MSANARSLLPAMRTIRIFVSSSFRDFGSERDLLVKMTFPLLKRLCSERDLTLVECDLRWGITDAQAETGQVIPICLNEVDNCRPYFICMLGERYGWVSNDFAEELKQSFPWIENYKGRSVTELEISHAVLNKYHSLGAFSTNVSGIERERAEATVSNSRFYFRDPSYIKTLPENVQVNYKSENFVSQDKMSQLKEQISKYLGKQVKKYSTPNEVAEMIYKDLKELIERDFPLDGNASDKFLRESSYHESMMKGLLRAYVKTKEAEDALMRFSTQNTTTPLVVCGDIGSGKSSLLANFAKTCKSSEDNFVIYYYVGASSQSTQIESLLQFILESLKRGLQLKRDLPWGGQDDNLINDFPSWIQYASEKTNKKIVIIIDGLNHLEKFRSLSFLPLEFPSSIRTVVSCSNNSLAQTLCDDRQWNNFYNLKPLTDEEKSNFMSEYLGLFTKKLSNEQHQLIVQSEKSSNPTFLKSVLEELRVFGHFESLTDRIKNYMSSNDITELYDKVLERMEKDYEEDLVNRKGLIGNIATTLYLSKAGVTEEEIMKMFNIPFAVWSPILFAIQSNLTSRQGGKLFLYSDALRSAIKKRYLKTPELEIKYRTNIVDFFSKEGSLRKIEEVPEQYLAMKKLPELYDFLQKVEVLDHYYLFGLQTDLFEQWKSLSDHFDLVSTYQNQLVNQTPSRIFKHVTSLFLYFGKYIAAKRVQEQHIEALKQNPNSTEFDVAEVFTSRSWTEYKERNYTEAESYGLQTLAILEKYNTRQAQIDLSSTLNSLGVLYKASKQFEKAEQMHKRSLEIKEKLFGKEHASVSWSLLNLGVLYRMQNKLDEAEKMFLESIKIFQSSVGSVHQSMSLRYNALARLYVDKADFEKAEEMFLKDLENRKKVYGNNHAELGYPLCGLAEMYYKMKNYEKSEQYYRETLRIQLKSMGEDHHVTAETYYELGLALEGLGKNEEALEFYEKYLKVADKKSMKMQSSIIESARERVEKLKMN